MHDIRKIDEFYLSTICHVCKKYTSSLKRCGACKLFAYCSTEHQKIHWDYHKVFCKAIKGLLNKNGKKRHHILDINGTKNSTSEAWKQIRIDLKVLWEHVLNRRLTPIEHQVCMFPRVCEICRTSKQDILFDCEICYSASYCCIEHKHIHMNIHEKFCQFLKLSYEIHFYLFNINNNTKLNLDINPNKIQDNCKLIPENTENFVKLYFSNDYYNDILIGDIVSSFLTIFHGLQTCDLIKNCNYVKNNFVVHMVGASLYEETLPWDFIIKLFFHWIENINTIIIVLIGPELQLMSNDTSTSLTPCGDRKNYKIIYERRLYHDYVNSQTAISADLIAVFNCGLHEYQRDAVNDIWAKSIYTLTSVSNVPLIITSYTLEESLLDFKRLAEFGEHFDVVIQSCKNSFAGLRPIRDWCTENSPVFFLNNYLTIVKTK